MNAPATSERGPRRPFSRRLAGIVSRSWILRRGRDLWKRNEHDWNLPLSRVDKLLCGAYLILRDTESGLFPPAPPQATSEAYSSELAYRESLPGFDVERVDEMHMRKPFWPQHVARLLEQYTTLVSSLERLGVAPPARLLELGCGSGWMSEFLALQGYDVLGTTLSPADVHQGECRRSSITAKGLRPSLEFAAVPMEEVDRVIETRERFDAVFVFEALHHAADWRQALRASFDCLHPGGWMLICEEPNRIHRYASYRVARLSNTREVGFTRGELKAGLRKAGFEDITVLRNRAHLGIRGHWLAGRRASHD